MGLNIDRCINKCPELHEKKLKQSPENLIPAILPHRLKFHYCCINHVCTYLMLRRLVIISQTSLAPQKHRYHL